MSDPLQQREHQKVPRSIALGPWENEVSFWQELVEKRRLPHLGHRGNPNSNPLRDELALGDIVFQGFGELPLDQLESAVPQRAVEWLKETTSLRRIYFDVTNIDQTARVFSIPANGFFARKELELILADEMLYAKTRLFENGTPLWRNGGTWLEIITRRNKRHLRFKLLRRQNQKKYVQSLLGV